MIYSYTNTFYSNSLCHHHTAIKSLKFTQTLGQFFEPHCWRPQILRDAKAMQSVNESVFNLHRAKNYIVNEFCTGAKDNKNTFKFGKSASKLHFAHLIFSHPFCRRQKTIRIEKPTSIQQNVQFIILPWCKRWPKYLIYVKLGFINFRQIQQNRKLGQNHVFCTTQNASSTVGST